MVTIGPSGCDALDIYADWYRQSEVDEDGCVLVRPDMFIAWRAKQASDNVASLLTDVFAQIFGQRSDQIGASVAAE